MCNHDFHKSFNLRRHIQQKHSEKDETLLCKKCGKSYKHEGYYKVHVSSCSGKHSVSAPRKKSVSDKSTLPRPFDFTIEIPSSIESAVAVSLINDYLGDYVQDLIILVIMYKT